ncbi:hypothetical protein LBMAG48_06800 [Phycisphaerae bacterium]|nr:hypothetical protein LBMAG48_06800 [Phycisphaerae bacterium]
MQFRRLFALAAITSVLVAAPARAQETIANEVSLGSTLFTIEDLENLTDAAKLTKEQQAAALELMRSAMARARTITLRAHRSMEDWPDEDGDQAKMMETWKKLGEERRTEVIDLEKSVMNDLKTLLEPDQANDGWPKFERSRRRLLLRGTQQVQQSMYYMLQQQGDNESAMYYYPGQEQGIPDLIGVLRASKLTKADMTSLDTVLEQYANSMDLLIKDYRAAAKPVLGTEWGYWGMEEKKLSKSDADTIKDRMEKMRQAHVRYARQVGETLQGEAAERFMRQRLRAEYTWQWQPSKRLPQVKAILKLRSLSDKQREQVTAAVKEADRKLMQFAIEDLKKQDEDMIAGKKDETPYWERQQTPEMMERQKKEAKVRKDLIKEVVALLDDRQRNAYETGIENEQDLANAFEKRRHGGNPWEGPDQELTGWDPSDWAGEDEEDQKE